MLWRLEKARYMHSTSGPPRTAAPTITMISFVGVAVLGDPFTIMS
jgi:hypothetical protein